MRVLLAEASSSLRADTDKEKERKIVFETMAKGKWITKPTCVLLQLTALCAESWRSLSSVNSAAVISVLRWPRFSAPPAHKEHSKN